jgi:hypothetical protein
MTRDDADGERVTVRLPAELPVLTRSASRILLAILVELAEREISDGPREGDGRDC